MATHGIVSQAASLAASGITNAAHEFWNQTPDQLIEQTILRSQGTLADSGALVINTGEFTGRSPKDKFVVEDDNTRDTVWWGSVNHKLSKDAFNALLARVKAYFQGRDVFVRDLYAGADPDYRLRVRVINETPWANLFVYNMFIRPSADELAAFEPEWTIYAAPTFRADGPADGLRQHNATIIDFTQKIILIMGSGYTGEMKKGIFTVLNYVLPFQGSLPMHCSANIGPEGDTALFYGLSGTGKTTLSADPTRALIGDDEHGWTPKGVFNFEGGCYAKVINLSAEGEPQIWAAVRYGALLENVGYLPGTRTVDFANAHVNITENTRVSYPIHFIPGAVSPSVGSIPKNIFFLTADAFGVLPPISRLSTGQAMYQFLSGYTAKVAGTELGVTEPQPTFSPCFGQAFLPLHPTKYAEMLGEKINQHGTRVWLINTGWTGGSYGVGSRMKLRFTRAMISAALNGSLETVAYDTDPIFGLSFPTHVPEVPAEVLNPRNTWADKDAYDRTAYGLAAKFNEEFAKYSDFASDEIKAAAPRTHA